MKKILVLFILSLSSLVYAEEPIFSLDPTLKAQISSLLSDIPIDTGGGCSVDKATYMAQLIKQYNLKTTVDIGIYRGRSFFPQALAHKAFTNGIVYGVDPFSPVEAKQSNHGNIQPQLDAFIIDTDFEGLFSSVVRFQKMHQLNEHSQILRMRSDEASKYFQKNHLELDLVHIDGNHDREAVLSDVKLYLKLIKPNGFLVMDDISWDSVKPALDLALEHTKILFILQDFVTNDFIILQKTSEF